jgi:hypothetical protein
LVVIGVAVIGVLTAEEVLATLEVLATVHFHVRRHLGRRISS